MKRPIIASSCVLALALSTSALAQGAAADNAQAYAAPRQAAAMASAPGDASAPLTRAQVLADLAVWKKSGMSDLYRGNQEPDVYSAKYRKRYAEYLRLRNGPEYQAALRREQERGN
ncbi:DUF4148 domain-containing protein [Achromobacter xylosoxidans]